MIKTRTLAGFLFALAAGTIWGTTGPLSTALYAEGQHLAGIGAGVARPWTHA